ncbi:hypothetical protein CQ046_10990 [Chryseobacterium sp. MYb7]|uniref:hypothetical protein n=1 Tax=Chryseobacterium sp. MYb7 TaxID=1827290 RepID=UPI000CFF5D4A|nr:hypothetical protein [Chryseobacterium sp. MYb7]PRB03073.1 hypothetical protein CQ046_10990 [Chryseobacterium sp. MYb7]
MNYDNYFNDFDDFDETSKRTLQSLSNHLLSSESFFSKTLKQPTDLQKETSLPPASSSVSDITDWQTDEYINLELLVSKIKYANSGMRDYMLEYNPNEYQSNTQNKSISLPGKNFIRLKAYLNSKAENVSVKWNKTQITQEIAVNKKKIYYRINFLYGQSAEKAIILETCSYQEFRDLNIVLGYGDIDNYDDDYKYFLKNFADALKKHENSESLKFIYENIPETILSGLSEHIDNLRLFNHLEILSNGDDSDIFKDSSSAVIQVFKAIGDPVPVLAYFRENPDKLNRIYYNLDGSTEYDGKMQTNRMILANIMMLFSMFANNDKRKKEAKSFTIGKGYTINSDILERGIFQGSNDQYRDTFFLQQQKEVQRNVKIVPKEGDPNATENVTEDLDEGTQFHPLDMVYLTDISGEKEETYLVPAIYLKALADAEEWAVVQQNIRIAANLVAIVIGVATLAATGNPYFILLAAADISLAGADLTVQAFKEEIATYEGGAEFLAVWEEIYRVGGIALAGLTVVGGFYSGAAKLIAKMADGSAKNYLKTLVLKAVLETNISNFQRNTIKVLEPKEIFLGAEYRALGNTMAENGVIFLYGQREGKFLNAYALVYKGEVIEEFTKAEMHMFYKKWRNLQGEKLVEELEHLGGHVPPGFSIVETTVEAEVKAFIVGKKQFSNTIIKNPFEKMKEAMPYFNHELVNNVIKQVGYENCANVVEVIIGFLKTGELRVAEPSGFQPFEDIIAKCGGGRFGETTIPSLAKEGILVENEIAIIYGAKKYYPSGKVDGHYFVAVKKEKRLHLFDGQTGEYVIFAQTREYGNFIQRNYKKFMYTKAGQIKQ